MQLSLLFQYHQQALLKGTATWQRLQIYYQLGLQRSSCKLSIHHYPAELNQYDFFSFQVGLEDRLQA